MINCNRKIKSISFTSKEFELLEYTSDKGKFSEFIKFLIKKDMNSKTNLTPEIKDDIREYVKECFGVFHKEVNDESKSDDEVKCSLDDILNM
ncbi:MAG TPA: hypothetical protein VIK86_04320 [Candidatus Paceibacterota bacterium]